MRAIIISLNKEDRSREYVLKHTFRIGRSDDNDLVLPKKYISRRQATVEFEKGMFVIKDLGSRNPTIINSRPVKEYVLQDGDQLEICDFKFRVAIEQEQPVQANYGFTSPSEEDEEDEEDTEGTSFIDMSRFVQEADREDLGSVNQIQFGGAVEMEEESEVEIPSISSFSRPSKAPQNKGGNSSVGKNSSAPTFEPAFVDDEVEEAVDFEIAPTFEPTFVEESDEVEEAVDFEIAPTFEPTFVEESDDEEEAGDFEIAPTFEPTFVEESDDEEEAGDFEIVPTFEPTFVEESDDEEEAGDFEIVPTFSSEEEDDEDDEDEEDEEDDDDDDKVMLDPPLGMAGPSQEAQMAMELPFLSPKLSGHDELEGTAIVDLSSVIAAVPPGLMPEEEDEKFDPTDSFTGSLSDLLAKKSSSPATPPGVSKSQPQKGSAQNPLQPPKAAAPKAAAPKAAAPKAAAPKATTPKTAAPKGATPKPQAPKSKVEQGSSIKFMPPSQADDDDDDDDGTDMVEITLDTKDDDEGTDIVTPDGDKKAKGDQTAQLTAVGAPKKKKGKLASADAIGVAGGVEEEEEEDDEYYLDPDGTGSFNVNQFREKKKTEKKIEKLTLVGLCCIGLLMAIGVIHWVVNPKGGPKVEKFKIKMVAKSNLKKDWLNPVENRIEKVKMAFARGEQIQYKELPQREGQIFNDDYLTIERILVPRNPTFFLFLPKKEFPKKEKRVLILEFKNQSVQQIFLSIGPAPPDVDKKNDFLKPLKDLPRQEKEIKVSALVKEAQKLWYGRTIPGNEADYEHSLERYKKSLWLMETYRPDEFNLEWEDKFKQLKSELDIAEEETKNFLSKLQNEFIRYARQKNKDKACEKLDQILLLAGNDKNSPIYIRSEIYRKYYYKR